MSQPKLNKRLWAATLLAGIALFVFTEPAWALFGRWAVAAVAVGATEPQTLPPCGSERGRIAASRGNGQRAVMRPMPLPRPRSSLRPPRKQAAARAAAAPPAPAKTAQQKLAELQSLYDQKLISQSDYQAAKTKILNSM